MSERKEYETFLPWRDVVAALHYATSSIHLENATSPEKETNLCMLYQHFMPCLCSIRIYSHTSTIFGKECICRTSFSFSLCSHFFWHTILTCFRTDQWSFISNTFSFFLYSQSNPTVFIPADKQLYCRQNWFHFLIWMWTYLMQLRKRHKRDLSSGILSEKILLYKMDLDNINFLF